MKHLLNLFLAGLADLFSICNPNIDFQAPVPTVMNVDSSFWLREISAALVCKDGAYMKSSHR